MATFEAQVEGLTSLSIDGSSAPTQDELTQFLTDGAKEIINILPPNLIDLCSASQSFTSGTADTLNTGKVLRVFRSDCDIKQPCRPIPASYKGRYSDPDDMNYATVTDPVFYIENNSLDVLPNGGTCTYSEVQYPAVVYSASDISVFPDEAEHLVVLYAAIKTLQNKMGSKSSSLPDDLIEPVLSEVSENLSSFTIPGSFILPTVPSDTDVNFSSVPLAPTYTNPTVFLNSAPVISNLVISAIAPFTPSLSTVEFLSVDSNFDTTSPTFTTAIAESSSIYTGSAPSYTKPVVALGAAPTISDLSISAVPPEPPTISASSLSFSATPPPYTPPTTSISGVVWATEYPPTEVDLNTALSAIVSAIGQAATAADKFLTDASDSVFGDEATFTTTDSQLTRVKESLDKAQHLMSDDTSYNALTGVTDDVTNVSALYWLGQEDSEMVSSTLQMVQIEIQRAQVHIQEWVSIGDMRAKEVDVAIKEAQAYTQEVQTRLAVTGTKVQEYQARVQDALNEFNEHNSEYQAELQRSIENARHEDSEETKKIQKYSAELQQYQAEVGAEVQEYQQNLDGDLRVWQAERTTDLQKYSSDIQIETSRFASDLNVYQQEIQKVLQTYQAETGYDMSKYDSEVRAQTSKFVSDLQKETEIFRTSMERYVNELQMITENNRSKLSKYATDIQNYNSKMQKHGVDYQWIQGQYAQLKAEYDQGLQLLIGGGIPQ